MRQGDEGRRRQDRPRHRMASSLPIGKAGHEQHGNTLPKITEETPAHARRLDHGADRPQRLSARRHDLGDAAGAQEVRPVRGAAAGAVASDHSLGAQERRHRVLPRTDRGHALFRDRGRRPARVPAERRHHHRDRGSSPARARTASPARPSSLPARGRARRSPPPTRSRSIGSPAACSRRNAARSRSDYPGRAVRGDDDRLRPR